MTAGDRLPDGKLQFGDATIKVVFAHCASLIPRMLNLSHSTHGCPMCLFLSGCHEEHIHRSGRPAGQEGVEWCERLELGTSSAEEGTWHSDIDWLAILSCLVTFNVIIMLVEKVVAGSLLSCLVFLKVSFCLDVLRQVFVLHISATTISFCLLIVWSIL